MFFDRCCHDGELTLKRKEFEVAFPGDPNIELHNLQEFCDGKALILKINTVDQSFTFKLGEPEII